MAVHHNCPTCRCPETRIGPTRQMVPTESAHWLRRYGDGWSIAKITSRMGGSTENTSRNIRRIDVRILRAIAIPRHVTSLVNERMERLRAAGCFEGLRRNGLLRDGTHPSTIAIPPQGN